MTRIVTIVAAIALAVVALAVLFLALLPRESLKTRMGEQIAAWTGRAVSLRGEPELDFFPELSVTLNDVRVGGPDGMDDAEIIAMDRLTGVVRLLPLIIGEVEIGSFTMVRPRVRLVVGQNSRRNWAFDSGAAALQLAFAGDVPLGDFNLEDGVVLYENRREGTTERLDSVNLRVAWPSVRKPVLLSGSGIWRGEQVSFSGAAEAPFDFLRGDATPVEATFESAPLAMTFFGEGSDVNSPRLNGALTMSTPSLRGFAAWLGSPVGPGSTFGPATLSGAATLQDRVLAVEDARLSLDGNDATGALKVVVAPVPDITGTLAFPALDLSPYLAGFAAAFDGGGNWRSVKLGTGWFGAVSADIRLSAGAMQARSLQFGATAATVSLRNAHMEIGVAQTVFEGGAVAGSLALTDMTGPAGTTVAAQFRADGFNLADAATALGVPVATSGAASLMVDLNSRGADLGTLVDNLAGVTRLDLQNGAFPLLGIAEIAVGGAGADSRATGVAATTPSRSLTAGFSFARGIALLERASVTALSFTADAKGWIVLKDGTLGLNGSVRPSALESAPASIPFTVEGTLRSPVARPLAAAN